MQGKQVRIVLKEKKSVLEGEVLSGENNKLTLGTNSRTEEEKICLLFDQIEEISAVDEATKADSMSAHDGCMKVDTEIKDDVNKKYNLTLNEAEEKIKKAFSLQAPSNVSKQLLGSLDDMQEEEWNQFDLNNHLYRVNSTYSEDKYNSAIDHSKISDEVKRAAEKIEEELKMTKSKSSHLNEERGIAMSEDETNEEVKYSSVERPTKKLPKGLKISQKKEKPKKWKPIYIVIAAIILLVIFVSYRIYKLSTKYSKYKK